MKRIDDADALEPGVDHELLVMVRRFAADDRVLVSWLQRGGRVAITKVETDVEVRGQGRARKVLEEICAWADVRGHVLAVTPSATWGADVARLTGFYMSLGFRVNLEPARMFEVHEPMLRDPRGGDHMRDFSTTPLTQPQDEETPVVEED